MRIFGFYIYGVKRERVSKIRLEKKLRKFMGLETYITKVLAIGGLLVELEVYKNKIELLKRRRDEC